MQVQLHSLFIQPGRQVYPVTMYFDVPTKQSSTFFTNKFKKSSIKWRVSVAAVYTSSFNICSNSPTAMCPVYHILKQDMFSSYISKTQWGLKSGTSLSSHRHALHPNLMNTYIPLFLDTNYYFETFLSLNLVKRRLIATYSD